MKSATRILLGLSTISIAAATMAARAPFKDIAKAEVKDATGKSLGTLTFSITGDPAVLTGTRSVTINGTLTGLPPGVHGIHIHTVGKCDAPGFTTAGGHFNPTDKKHGFDSPSGPHAGDMHNITASSSGTAKVNEKIDGIELTKLMDADGAAVVVHATADDYKTDPSGNSGGRIACGVLVTSG